jgi:hypothetical protein
VSEHGVRIERFTEPVELITSYWEPRVRRRGDAYWNIELCCLVITPDDIAVLPVGVAETDEPSFVFLLRLKPLGFAKLACDCYGITTKHKPTKESVSRDAQLTYKG